MSCHNSHKEELQVSSPWHRKYILKTYTSVWFWCQFCQKSTGWTVFLLSSGDDVRMYCMCSFSWSAPLHRRFAALYSPDGLVLLCHPWPTLFSPHRPILRSPGSEGPGGSLVHTLPLPRGSESAKLLQPFPRGPRRATGREAPVRSPELQGAQGAGPRAGVQAEAGRQAELGPHSPRVPWQSWGTGPRGRPTAHVSGSLGVKPGDPWGAGYQEHTVRRALVLPMLETGQKERRKHDKHWLSSTEEYIFSPRRNISKADVERNT